MLTIGQPKSLSANTVRNIHQILSYALRLAWERRIIPTNPAEGRALPKVEHREMKALPVEQLQSFLREARESGVFELYYLELATGLRRGELLGLKWEDIDLGLGDLRVRRQVDKTQIDVVFCPHMIFVVWLTCFCNISRLYHFNVVEYHK